MKKVLTKPKRIHYEVFFFYQMVLAMVEATQFDERFRYALYTSSACSN